MGLLAKSQDKSGTDDESLCHRRWDAGFRITACAATPDQSAFVISVPRRRPMDETQETLRTSAFPSSHVKEKWAKNLYIAGIAYGRTVS
jgi:hypothetical protein